MQPRKKSWDRQQKQKPTLSRFLRHAEINILDTPDTFAAKTTIEPHLWEIKEHYEEVATLKKAIEELKNAN